MSAQVALVPPAPVYAARRYRPEDAAAWDDFVGRSPKGTVLHSRRFLDYHGDRFEDRSLLLTEGHKTVAVFGAVTHPARPHEVVSHLGSTFGGPLLAKVGAAEETFDVLASVAEHYRGEGVRRLVLKLTPAHVAEQPDEAERSALFRLGGRVDREDLWSVVALDRARKRRDIASARKAARLGVRVQTESSDAAYAEVHALLSETLRRRHGASPVHTVEELLTLRGRLGDAQELWTARLATGELAAAGWILWHRPGVIHTQYLAASDAAREARALDALLEELSVYATERGARVLSFGASTEDGGRRLNAPLHAFKSKLGGGAVTQTFVTWDL